jgi:hypothetical protein
MTRLRVWRTALVHMRWIKFRKQFDTPLGTKEGRIGLLGPFIYNPARKTVLNLC